MRRTKQLLFGILFLSIFALIGFGIYKAAYHPVPSCTDGRQNQGEKDIDCGGPCAPCGIAQAQELQVTSKRVFRAADGSGVVIELHNPNNEWGVRSLNYTLSLKDQFGKELFRVSNASFLYPGEIKYIIEPYVKYPFSSIASIDIDFSNIQWIAADEFKRPSIDAQDIKTFRDRQVFVAGKIANRDQSSYGPLTVSALLFNKDNELVAASRVGVASLERLSTADFSIAFAKDLSLYEPYIAPSFSFARTMKRGDSGTDVGNLQQILREQGLYGQEPTGYYDGATEEALASFQQKSGLVPTGKFDEATRSYMQKLIEDTTPQQSEEQKDTSVDISKTKVFVETKRQ
jgi:hypothetical protein